ncbi:SDR family NAD(P)-dependent oxidoreductase [Sphingobium lignivorans]|uniref:NAD(P)-dependent dehydrogenase (Short-subunit alcohol dehydrogenase family) n=1 Tax=Sphingobium lignivorans TaxID=2735886 RepID=A0ABR6NDU7_9SPHN|nr:SDR family NAD(P)-dependent oxidoreductase [Sphingobium lignivorans]MBB5985236.1 NAD(P)-dependent dehydrogenase (short-subunit alcohol dehydrogenase family) [Sphingobium lignivorans]
MSDLAGRHIIVTGASSGIGLATARMLAARGAKVSMIARRIDALAAQAGEIGPGASAFAADVGDKAALESALQAAADRFGPAYGLFANAGMAGNFAPALDYPGELFEDVLRVNLTSVFWAMQAVLPAMIAAGEGSILVTGSMASKRGMAMNPAYVASKHGVLGLSRAIAVEMAPHGVRCNCVIPGFIDTPAFDLIPPDQAARINQRVPQRRMGSADELAEVACFLLSPAASHVTAQGWAVDGGVLETLEV